MNLPRSVRVLIALAMLVLGLAALLLVLTISEATLSIQAHLEARPAWISFMWWGALAGGGLVFGWILWRLLRPRPAKPSPANAAVEVISEQQVEAALEKAEALGADTRGIRQELEELNRRREVGDIHVALFGEVSTGKSALVRALLPGAQAHSDVLGGTTREIVQYRWSSPGGDALIISDMPGTDEAGATLDTIASEEAKRAHIVVYVVDSDLNRRQHAALQELLELGKPLVLVLNKTDRYSAQDAERLAEKMRALLADHDNARFAQVSAATSRQLVRQLPDGSEQTETRMVAPQVEALGKALQRLVDNDPAILDRLRDSATFVLAQQKLDHAMTELRREKADKLVDSYALKAMAGAMAAITPGSDLVIQGWLGTRLVRELAALYDTKPGKVDTELLLKLVQRHVGKAHTLLLAVAGNALKAFPGIGTLAGGALHAVAYGIIFRTLGRALTSTLATRGELHPRQAAKLFEESLGEDLESSARRLARVAVEQVRSDTR